MVPKIPCLKVKTGSVMLPEANIDVLKMGSRWVFAEATVHFDFSTSRLAICKERFWAIAVWIASFSVNTGVEDAGSSARHKHAADITVAITATPARVLA